jgi:hypothetical protein
MRGGARSLGVVGLSRNGVADADERARVLKREDSERVADILSFGYWAREIDPARRTSEEWIAAAHRNPFRRDRHVRLIPPAARWHRGSFNSARRVDDGTETRAKRRFC